MKINKFIISIIGILFCLNLYGEKIPDSYYTEISEKLSEWIPTKTPNQESTVFITIDKNGKFDYIIISKAKDIEFNESLKYFLDKQRDIKYPTYQNTIFKNEVTFKSDIK